MRRTMGLLAVLALGGPALAQTAAPPAPAACVAGAGGDVDHQACADAASADSPARRLALINLGTEAFLRRDYAAAVGFYDAAEPRDGQQLYSDASFHAFRSAAYRHVGRASESLTEARTALTLLTGTEELPLSAEARLAAGRIDVELVYSLILPPLKAAADPRYPAALDRFLALPVRDWISLSSRAAVLEQLGDPRAALVVSEQVLALKPDEPAVLNNHCFILTRAGRAAEALDFCERALAAAPNEATVRDSYAVALAGAGRCAQARAQLAEAQRLDPTAVAYRRTLACR